MQKFFYIFSLCSDVETIYPCNFQTDLPITLLLTAVAVGRQLELGSDFERFKTTFKHFSIAINFDVIKTIQVFLWLDSFSQ